MGEILYESKDGIIHACESGQISNDNSTYVVWTKCGVDVPTNEAFGGIEKVSCPECLEYKG